MIRKSHPSILSQRLHHISKYSMKALNYFYLFCFLKIGIVAKKTKKTVSRKSNSRPSSRISTPVHSSSGEEEYSFITDSSQVEKIACTWLGK